MHAEFMACSPTPLLGQALPCTILGYTPDEWKTVIIPNLYSKHWHESIRIET
jgi:hypothetical protein